MPGLQTPADVAAEHRQAAMKHPNSSGAAGIDQALPSRNPRRGARMLQDLYKPMTTGELFLESLSSGVISHAEQAAMQRLGRRVAPHLQRHRQVLNEWIEPPEQDGSPMHE